jgi:mannose/fructose-specific phosphotransferase system component IIA
MTDHAFHIIIATHETLCEGYLKTANLILMSDANGVSTLPFKENMDLLVFESHMNELIQKHTLQPIIILTDLMGGTPNNIAVKQLVSPKVQLVTSINLPLFLELLMGQETGMSLNEIDLNNAIKNARNSLVHMNTMIDEL